MLAHLYNSTGKVCPVPLQALSLRVGLTRASTGVMYGEGSPGGKGKEHLTHISRVSWLPLPCRAASSEGGLHSPITNVGAHMQAQGNLAEYIGIFVVLLAVLELNGASEGSCD